MRLYTLLNEVFKKTSQKIPNISSSVVLKEVTSVSANSEIKQLKLMVRHNGNFLLSIEAPSENAANALATFSKSLGLDTGYISGKYLSLSANDPEVIAYFAKKIVHFAHYPQTALDAIYEELKILPDPSYQLPSWYRDGNYEVTRDYGRASPLIRSVKFASTSLIAPIKWIDLCGYKDGSAAIQLKLSSHEAFNNLDRALIAEGFPTRKAVDRIGGSTYFHNEDMKVIAHFLATIVKCDPSLASIKREIASTLHINLDQSFSKHKWIVTGNFHDKFISGAQLNRQLKIEYTKVNSSPLTQVELLGYDDGSIRMRVELKNGIDIKEMIKNAKMDFPNIQIDNSVFSNALFFNGNQSNVLPFLNVLRFVKTLVGNDFKEVEQHLLDALKIRMRSLFERAIDDVKQQARPADPVRRSARLKGAKVHSKVASFMTRFVNQLEEGCDEVANVADEIIDDMARALDELTLELENLVLEAGEAIDETLDALEQCFAPVVHQFTQMNVSVPRERIALLPESKAAANLVNKKVKM
jgi:hypothetical protein